MKKRSARFKFDSGSKIKRIGKHSSTKPNHLSWGGEILERDGRRANFLPRKRVGRQLWV